MISSIILTLLCLAFGCATYDVHPFRKATFWVDNFGNYRTTGFSILTFNDDQTFMAVKGSFTKDPLEIYYKNSTGYSFLYPLIPSDSTSVTIRYAKLLGASSYVVAVVTYSDNNVRIFQINQTRGVQYQIITYTAFAYLNARNLNAFLLTESTKTNVMLWNQATQRYIYTYSTSGVSGSPACRGISANGQYFIQDQYNSTSTLELYVLSGGNYTAGGTYDISPWTCAEVKQITFYNDTTGSFYAVVNRQGAMYETIVLRISGSSLSLQSTFGLLADVFTYSSISLDGLYVLGYSSPSTVRYYHYNSSLGTYSLEYWSNSFPNTIAPNAVYNSNNGQFFAVGCSSKSDSTYQNQMGFIYFICSVANCSRCSFLDVCQTSSSTNSTNSSSSSASTSGTSVSTSEENSQYESLKFLLIVLIIVVVLLMIGLFLQFVYFLMKIRNLSSSEKGEEKYEEEKIKEEKVQKSNNKHLKNSNSETFMTELVFTEEVEDQTTGNVISDHVPKRKRRMKNDGKSMSEVRVEPNANLATINQE